MTAAAIEALRQGAGESVTVVLSGGEEIPCTANIVADMRLYRGRELDGAEYSKLRAASALAQTKRRAIDLLSRRSYSSKDLYDRLVQKGEEPQRTAACIRWLQDNRLLDDESYAAAVVRHYSAKGYGPARIRQELSRRGIEKELRDEALSGRPDNTEKINAFIAARLRDPGDRDQVRKLTAALFRRGYGWEDIRAALARFRAEAEYEDE